MLVSLCLFFFFQQKTAYEMRISDWSSDVCSSDLDYVYSRTVNPEDAPDQPEIITIDFERGDGIALNGRAMSPATLLAALNDLGRKHGIGRLDLVENRFVGMKSRGMYETPGGTIYQCAHRGQIGRAACRERVGQYAWTSVVAVSTK